MLEGGSQRQCLGPGGRWNARRGRALSEGREGQAFHLEISGSVGLLRY